MQYWKSHHSTSLPVHYSIRHTLFDLVVLRIQSNLLQQNKMKINFNFLHFYYSSKTLHWIITNPQNFNGCLSPFKTRIMSSRKCLNWWNTIFVLLRWEMLVYLRINNCHIQKKYNFMVMWPNLHKFAFDV